MFPLVRTILMRQKQSISTYYLNNVFQNVSPREYSKCLAVVVSNKKYFTMSETLRFYSKQLPNEPPSPTKEIPPTKEPVVRSPPKKGKKFVNKKETIDEHMIIESIQRPDQEVLTFEQKMRRTTETGWYFTIMMAGFCVIITVIVVLIREIVSEDSPNNIYSKTFKLCKANTEVQDALGMPLKCYGEETRRGYRRHIAHQVFETNGIKQIRMKFYIQGAFRKGTVHLEKIANKKGYYDLYSYIIVDLDGYPSRRIIVDNGGFPDEETM